MSEAASGRALGCATGSMPLSRITPPPRSADLAVEAVLNRIQAHFRWPRLNSCRAGVTTLRTRLRAPAPFSTHLHAKRGRECGFLQPSATRLGCSGRDGALVTKQFLNRCPRLPASARKSPAGSFRMSVARDQS